MFMKITSILFLLFSVSLYSQNIVWQKNIGSAQTDRFYKIIKTPYDSGYICLGEATSNVDDSIKNHGNSDIWVLKLDKKGNKIWSKTFGGTNGDVAFLGFPSHCILVTQDSGFLFAVYTESNDGDVTSNKGNGDIWIVKVNKAGKLIWQKTYGGASKDVPYGMIQSSNGNYIIVGYTGSTDGDINVVTGSDVNLFILSIDGNGKKQFMNSYGGSGVDYGKSISQADDGGYLVIGEANSQDGSVRGTHDNSRDIWVTKFDNKGKLKWGKTFGGTGNDYCSGHIITKDKKIIIGGNTDGYTGGDVKSKFHGGDLDAWVLILEKDTNIYWEKCLGGSGDEDWITDISPFTNGGYFLSAYTDSKNGSLQNSKFHGNIDAWIMKFKDDTALQWRQCYGGSDLDYSNSITDAWDGGLLFSGTAKSTNGDLIGNTTKGNGWVVKLNDTSIVTTSFLNTTSQTNLNIFPNPSCGIFNLSSIQEITGTLEIINVFGQRVLLKSIKDENRTLIDLSMQPKGVYFVKFINGISLLSSFSKIVVE
ncbi:MAG: T9SS type A sorting domain-containing protein [Bacteroidetes bacterium]|nr:T9SS type A sorting domain-containing protein [Bacteroidota bacterium]